jgi:hypothetical protein
MLEMCVGLHVKCYYAVLTKIGNMLTNFIVKRSSIILEIHEVVLELLVVNVQIDTARLMGPFSQVFRFV